MPKKKHAPEKKSAPARRSASRRASLRRRLPPAIIALLLALGLAALLTASGFAFAATQESHDPFCASCHTQPESTYYQREEQGTPVDLASAHTANKARCIDCHSGPHIAGRIGAELLGAHNALAFYTRTAVQPAPLTHPVGDENCLKCHQQVTLERSQNNHFHFFLARWQAQDPAAATCVSCHSAHTTDGDAQIGFLNRDRTTAVCDACHRATGQGE